MRTQPLRPIPGPRGWRRRSESGLTILEVLIGAIIGASVLGGTARLFSTSRDLATSMCDQHLADLHVERGLAVVEQDFRHGSLATMQHLDTTSFDDGDAGAGIAFQRVAAWQGAAVLDARVEYRLETSLGELSGTLIRSDGGIESALATGITAFVVTREGPVFTFTLSARSAATDDRERTSTATLSVLARNP